MTKHYYLFVPLFLVWISCKPKPTELECQDAIDNIRRIRGLELYEAGRDPRSAVRSCRAFSNRGSVSCFLNANTEADLDACEKILDSATK